MEYYKQNRENHYKRSRIIEWEGMMLTVDEAHDLYRKYEIEDVILDELKKKIIEAKNKIREIVPK